MPIIRLDKFLSGQGVGARKEIRNFIKNGLIQINDKKAISADQKIDTDQDCIFYNGDKITYKQFVYFMMNKPQGIISASNDPKQTTVVDLLPETVRRPGLFPAGRLDKDTEGLLIITDDGDFAHSILSPKKHVWKNYYVIVDGSLDEEEKNMIENGMTLSDGTQFSPAKLEIIKKEANAEAVIMIHEGKFHQIKRMFGELSKKVVYLKRLSVGNISLDETLKPGEYREMAVEEIKSI